jgi:hypothetical protein
VTDTATASASAAAGATPTLTGPFTSAGIALSVDMAAHEAKPADYVTSVPASSSAMYVVFALKPNTTGRLSVDVTSGGSTVLAAPITIEYGTINSWGNFKINFGSGIATGAYVATVTYEPTGDKVVLNFTVD